MQGRIGCYNNIMLFSRKWIKPQSQNVGNRILEGIKPNSPLKPRIEEAQQKLQLQVSKLDSIASKMEEKDQEIFKKIIQALQSHETQHAKILSSELSQVRKMNKTVSSARLAIEQIQLRLNTVTELGDVVVTLSPAMSVIKGIRGGLSSMLPEADQSFSQISDILSSIITESEQRPIAEINEFSGLDEDSTKIVEEANSTIERNIKNKLPNFSETNLESKKTEASLY
jgi:division protein CdvB (Snf7/Vps24/ESCRT-III family)